MFRKNPSKTSVFVPKSSGLGWTLNPRHPLGWIILGALFILAVYKIFIN